MTIGDQHHGRVSMSVAAVLAGIVPELFDLAKGQVFSNCTVYSGWWAGIPSSHRKSSSLNALREPRGRPAGFPRDAQYGATLRDAGGRWKSVDVRNPNWNSSKIRTN